MRVLINALNARKGEGRLPVQPAALCAAGRLVKYRIAGRAIVQIVDIHARSAIPPGRPMAGESSRSIWERFCLQSLLRQGDSFTFESDLRNVHVLTAGHLLVRVIPN